MGWNSTETKSIYGEINMKGDFPNKEKKEMKKGEREIKKNIVTKK